MPIFKLKKAFGVGWGVKMFFDFRGGATRGAVPDFPDLDRHEELRKTLEKQKRHMEKQKRHIQAQDRRIKDTHRKLANRRMSLRQQSIEIFRLRNELEALNERACRVPEDPSSVLEVGALPDFVIVGAQKCGTTRLYDLLAQHPNFEPGAVRETHFFDQLRNYEKGVGWYRSLFLKPKQEDGLRSITGEKTPSYLFHPKAPERMAEVMPDVRLIALLRDPVDRAYSHYHHLARPGYEERSFEAAVEEELEMLEAGDDGGGRGAGLLSRGIYVDQLARWQRFFDEGQILVLKSEDFFERSTEILAEILDFLGLPRHKIEIDPSGTKNHYEPMDPATRKRLGAFFEPHNKRLYDHLGRNLGW